MMVENLIKLRFMKKVKILLGDPRHYTVGAHSSYVPINIGYIGSFLKQEIKDIDLEIKLEVVPEKIFSELDNWKPDIVGLSNYVWNSSLTNAICEYAKKLNIEKLDLVIEILQSFNQDIAKKYVNFYEKVTGNKWGVIK